MTNRPSNRCGYIIIIVMLLFSLLSSAQTQVQNYLDGEVWPQLPKTASSYGKPYLAFRTGTLYVRFAPSTSKQISENHIDLYALDTLNLSASLRRAINMNGVVKLEKVYQHFEQNQRRAR